MPSAALLSPPFHVHVVLLRHGTWTIVVNKGQHDGDTQSSVASARFSRVRPEGGGGGVDLKKKKIKWGVGGICGIAALLVFLVILSLLNLNPCFFSLNSGRFCCGQPSAPSLWRPGSSLVLPPDVEPQPVWSGTVAPAEPHAERGGQQCPARGGG